MKAEITKRLITDDGKSFEIDNDICFQLNRNGKIYNCCGIITNIYERCFRITMVMIDGSYNICDELTVSFSEVKNGKINYTPSNLTISRKYNFENFYKWRMIYD